MTFKIRDTLLEKYKEGISVSLYSDQLRQTLFKMLMNLKYILNQNQQNIWSVNRMKIFWKHKTFALILETNEKY